MRQSKAREIKIIAEHTYTKKLKKVGITLKNYYRNLKREYVRGTLTK